MKTVRDHKRFIGGMPYRTTDDALRKFYVLHEWTEPITTSEDVTVSAPQFKTNTIAITLPISSEMIEDITFVRSAHDAMLNNMLRHWTTSESVELHPDVTRDDAAVALWQAANTIAEIQRQLKEANAKIERMQATAQSMFGDTDTYAIAELLGIPTEY